MPDTIFYDGGCGLCHWFVRAVILRDRRRVFRFAPLEGATFDRIVPRDERAGLPDSVVVRTTDGRLLIRSAAVLHVLGQLGRCWRVFAGMLRAVPASLRDAVYNVIARTRRRLWRTPSTACPLLPRDLLSRFDP
ncbi:MAG: DUF393 domain-containing protein [Bryobacteraceae bacterium]